MADEKVNQASASQQAQTEPDPPAEDRKSNESSATATAEATIDQARRFLEDDSVRRSSAEKKTEFLKSKGFRDEQIQALLGETDGAAIAERPRSEPRDAPSQGPERSSAAPPATTESRSDIPPIITYPEFLTTSPRPPPLITPSSLFNILTVTGSIWTLVYGTAQYVVNPMVDNLNDSRSDYYGHVNEKLGELVERLENAASEVPYKNGKLVLKSRATADDRAHEETESTFSDPTELFHRDIGTQTSPPLSPGLSVASSSAGNLVDKQASRLSALRASLHELNDMYTRRTEASADLNATLRSLRDDIDNLALPPPTEYAMMHNSAQRQNDEFKRTKDAIRSVKGMFLSTRSFPTVMTR
ncbi:hypothetical protein DL766_006266 [Monosporascus sp. MC13-8B]|uniref:Peroxisomal membrane protein PEX14 n=1 Tax=Monosporascus cannonballus TaxID=155416 RepID=A0ABY0H9I8_9PEZI|nr:hypothetical protein DL762_003859 [Monosporascus cannonballus]RYO92852.1 hypothetical protein DL763_004577 [Monosporascus cannonballus]RYP27671.1 hypothetical protein DL766_006266 [Monosporascus sp. MC13-8B]